MATTNNSAKQGSQGRQIQKQSSSKGQKKSYGKKKVRYNYPRIIALLLGLIIVILLSVFGIKSCSKLTTSTAETPEDTSPEEIMQKNITVNGTSIKGLEKDEAKAAILADMNWELMVSYGSENYPLPNLYEAKVEEILTEIFDNYSSSNKAEYTLDDYLPEEELLSEIAAIALLWDIPAKDAGITDYDASANKFIFASEKAGKIINQEQLLSDLKLMIGSKEYKATVEAEGIESLPQLTEAQARAQYKTMATFTTKTTTNADRNRNITLACAAINGKIVQKGEIFSVNQATGERTIEKGYKAAGAYVNGILVEEPGGGVCQVSSTLYNAVINAGLKTIERYSHSYVSSYIAAGEDAMISYPNLDMKFKNDTMDAIGILASLNGTTLTISIYGIPVLEAGVTKEMYSETKEWLPLEVPTYEEDPTLGLGVEVVAKQPIAGCKVITYLITKKDGVEISREFLHNSTYNGKPAIIRRNTDPNATVSPQESQSDGSIEAETTVNSTTQSSETAAAKPTDSQPTTAAGPETVAAIPEAPKGDNSAPEEGQ